MDLNWQDPPTPAYRADWQQIADALKSNPGRWALIEEGASNATLVTRIHKGLIVAFRGGAFEAKARSTGGGEQNIYARFVGEA